MKNKKYILRAIRQEWQRQCKPRTSPSSFLIPSIRPIAWTQKPTEAQENGALSPEWMSDSARAVQLSRSPTGSEKLTSHRNGTGTESLSAPRAIKCLRQNNNVRALIVSADVCEWRMRPQAARTDMCPPGDRVPAVRWIKHASVPRTAAPDDGERYDHVTKPRPIASQTPGGYIAGPTCRFCWDDILVVSFLGNGLKRLEGEHSVVSSGPVNSQCVNEQ
ncbi:hypothetical protein ZHAS_00002979 [Anopheles sinensis]|uniref:Uncharacterized protein n=1 Tax=Anopheles sinensis TaxID=74873 RepID=A0A084VDF6_ANOSI|nr:hypothetical protein ZHAS_00002979 [Anopheles sinensis]